MRIQKDYYVNSKKSKSNWIISSVAYPPKSTTYTPKHVIYTFLLKLCKILHIFTKHKHIAPKIYNHITKNKTVSAMYLK